MAATNVISGARSRLKINGQIVGFAGDVSGGETIDYEPVDILDLLEVREFVPVAYKTSLNARVFRVIGKDLKALGIFPVEEDILTSGDLTITVEDKITGNTYAQFEQCKCAGHTFDVSARGIVSENIDFVAIRLRSEYENPI